MQQHNKRGNVVVLLLILIAVLAGAFLYLYKSGKLDGFLNRQDVIPPVSQVSKQDELTKGDEVQDIEKDLNSTDFTGTDKALGEVDKTLANP